MRDLSLSLVALSLTMAQGCVNWDEPTASAADSLLSADIPTEQDTAGSGPTDAATGEDDAPSVDAPSHVEVQTTLGTFVIRLDADAAPETVANFLTYVSDGFYDGTDGFGATTFHRVISGFMIQGGGMTASGVQKQTHPAIAHESPNGRLNLRGTVAMARQPAPDTATSQFFVNHVDNGFLDYVSESEPGYVVFGDVISGMETVDTIADVQTGPGDVPVTSVLIESVRLIPD